MPKTRVLVVEDSLLFRRLLEKYINEDPDLEVVAVANDPFEARDRILQFKPDVMTLDIELPKMNGIEFLRKLMPQYPIRTIVISSLSDKVFDALHAGAVDFVAKPITSDRQVLDEFIRKELPSKIKIASKAKLRKTYQSTQTPAKIDVSSNTGTSRTTANSTAMPKPPVPPVTTQGNAKSVGEVTRVRGSAGFTPTDDLIVAIGASTGGTEATAAILEMFGPDIPGVVVTQHMPEGFTKMYAQRLDQRVVDGITVKEAENGDIVRPGHIFIAPGGDRHMEVMKKGDHYVIVLKNEEKVNGHRPSVEVLFNSVAKAAGENAVGIILTGMGGDGAKGLLNMRNAGARTIGQDESTCVVYGMPRVAYEMGAVEVQEKLPDIAKKTYYLLEQIQKKKS